MDNTNNDNTNDIDNICSITKTSSSTSTQTSSFITFVEACERLDELNLVNCDDWVVSIEDARAIRQLLILSGALTEYRNEKRQIIKVFRHVHGTKEQIAALNNQHLFHEKWVLIAVNKNLGAENIVNKLSDNWRAFISVYLFCWVPLSSLHPWLLSFSTHPKLTYKHN